jgi:hypothetical protein
MIAVAEFGFVVRSVGAILVTRIANAEGGHRKMRLLKPTVVCLTVLVIGVFAVQGLHAQDNPDRAAPPQLTADRGDRSLRVEGDATALHVEVQQTTIADVLSALESFNVRYRSSIGLDEVVNGSYAGSLGHVVARLLNGYNYATKLDGSKLEVTIFGRRGEFAVPAPIVIPVRRRPSD